MYVHVHVHKALRTYFVVLRFTSYIVHVHCTYNVHAAPPKTKSRYHIFYFYFLDLIIHHLNSTPGRTLGLLSSQFLVRVLGPSR